MPFKVLLVVFLVTFPTYNQCLNTLAFAVQEGNAIHHSSSWGIRTRNNLKTLRTSPLNVLSNPVARKNNDDDESLEEIQNDANAPRQPQLVSLSLAASYFTVMGAKCALPSVLPLLMSPTIGVSFPSSWNSSTSPQAVFSQILTIATLSVALGKVLLGPVIDHYGGTASIKMALSALFLLLGTISLTSSFWVFTTCWCLIDFCFSSCWAACINAIHQNFDASQWGPQVGRLAMAARAGNSMAFAAFASILHIFQQRQWMRQYWRPVFMVASLIQLIPLAMLSLTAKHPRPISLSESSTSKSRFRQSMSTLQQEFRKLDFWLHLISRSVLMIFASFLLFVPTLATSVFGLSSSGGAQAASLYALGCLLSVTALSNAYSVSNKKQRLAMLTALLLGGATGSSVALLGHVASWWVVPPRLAVWLLFLWGFSFALPFYIPPSLYALARGGQLCSATITDAFDTIGFCLLAAFNGYVAGLSHTTVASWIPTFALTTMCSLVSFVSLIAVTARENESVRDTNN